MNEALPIIIAMIVAYALHLIFHMTQEHTKLGRAIHFSTQTVIFVAITLLFMRLFDLI